MERIMKRLLTTTALVLALGSTAHAQQSAQPTGQQTGQQMNQPAMNQPGMGSGVLLNTQMRGQYDLAVSELIGMRVYATDMELGPDMGTGTDVGNDAGADTNAGLQQTGVDGGMAADQGTARQSGVREGVQTGDQTQTAQTQTGQTMNRQGQPMTPGMNNQMGMNEPFTVEEGASTQWSDIGEINEIYISPNGEVAAVIVGVGGFLGMGEKDVALDMSQVRMVRVAGNDTDMYLVVNTTESELEAAPAFDRMAVGQGMNQQGMNQQGMTEQGMTQQGTQQQPRDQQTLAQTDAEPRDRNGLDANQPLFTQPAIEREGYAVAQPQELTAESLTGALVYGVNDEDIGDVSEILLSESGQVEAVIVDVGGFLGLGERPIAMSFDELQILRSADGGDFRIYVDATQEQLESRPEYQG